MIMRPLARLMMTALVLTAPLWLATQSPVGAMPTDASAVDAPISVMGGITTPPPPGSFMALCYHNVEDQDPDQTYDGTTTTKLIEQLSWLQHEGYTAISVDDLLAAREGRKALPAKSVLLTFDDGYESFYTRVYPVLRAFHFPAVIAVVDEWMPEKHGRGKANHKGGDAAGHGGQAGDRVQYGDTTMPRSAFLTWAQIREMKKSGLIEVASHSHAMHYGVMANPQGNSEPDALTSIYDPSTGTYETAEHYIHRLQADAAASVKTIKHETGKAPRVMVWPYGAYNEIGMLVQNRQGMPVTLSLEDGYGTVKDLKSTPRMLVKDDPNMSDFSILVRQFGKVQPLRTIEIDLDDVYNADAAVENSNIDALIARVYAMNINTVFLKAYADPDGSGIAREVYFPNRYLPVRQDLFNRVSWQLNTRANIHVYGWLPVLSFNFGADATASDEARHRIVGLYEDFGRHGPMDGLLFRDKALMANSVDAMIPFTQELASHVAAYRAPLKTVRSLYAPSDNDDIGKASFTEAYNHTFNAYDYVAIEAMPDRGDVSLGHQKKWLGKLVDVIGAHPLGLKKAVFELQATNPDSTEDIGAQMQLLARRGALNFGYYPDNFVTNTPDAAVLHKDFSLQTYPYLP